MSDNFETLQQFFTRIGLTVSKAFRTGSFGDYIVEACTSNLCLKGVSDRSVESVEVRSAKDPGEWFIMNIVMSYILKEKCLVEEIGREDQLIFVETHLADMEKLFSEEYYHHTRSELKELAALRGKILFPDWYE